MRNDNLFKLFIVWVDPIFCDLCYKLNTVIFIGLQCLVFFPPIGNSPIMLVFRHCFLLIGFALGMTVCGQNMNIRTYNVEHGIPQSQILAIHRDPQGFLWVGTYSGIARYNGRRWQSYSRKNGLSGNHANCFTTDHKGRLWVGTYGNGLSYFDGATFTRFPSNRPESMSRVYRIIEDKNRNIWAASDLGLLKLKNGEVVAHLTEANGLPSTDVWSVFEDQRGVIYVGTRNGIVAIVNDQGQELPFSEVFRGKHIKVIQEDQDRRLWIGTTDGLYFVEGNQATLLRHPILAESHVTALTLDRDTGIWIGTRHNGAFKLVGSQVTRSLDVSNGLGNDAISALLYDEEHTLWLGTDSGLARYRPGAFVALTNTHGLDATFVRCFYRTRDGRFLAGTRQGVYRIEGFKAVKFHPELFERYRVYSIQEHTDGTLMVATDEGLLIFRDGRVEVLDAAKGLPNPDLRSLFVDSRGWIWVGSNGLVRLDGNTFITFPEEHPLSSARIMNIAEDSKGWLWLGSTQGLIGYHPEKGEMRIPEGADAPVWDLDVDANDVLWVGTNGYGLWAYEDGALKRYTSDNSNLTNDFIWQVYCGRDGEVWAGHNLGIDRKAGDRWFHYNQSDGLAHNEGSATAVIGDSQNRIWFGTGHGISIFQPNEQALPLINPTVLVESARATDRRGVSFAVSRGIELERKQNNIQLTFAAPSYIKEERIDYSFKLDGLETEFSEPGHQPEVKYVNLSPGPYLFQVKARNEGGQWGPVTSFDFVVKPAFYETTWFRVSVVLVVILLVFAYTRARLVVMERRNMELEAIVKQRTDALVQKGREFRELSLSDPLTRVRNRRYVMETMREEMSRLKREYHGYEGKDNFTCLGVMVMDLDFFKSVNDRFGHDAGDSVLIATAERLKAVVRKSDIVARWGGEEFLVLLRDVHPEDLASMATKLLDAVRDRPYHIGGGRELTRTASLGYAYMHPALIMQDVPWEWAFKLADLALYRAKEGGRNMAFGVAYNPETKSESLIEVTQEDPQVGLKGDILSFVTP